MMIFDNFDRSGLVSWRPNLGGTRARCVASALLALALVGCATHPTDDRTQQTRIELPLVHGWFDGQIADYVTTDVSSATMARDSHANYVPRLANLLPGNQPRPNPHSAIARIYKFLNYVQPSVLPSAPTPPNANNTNEDYSPIWELMGVTWQAGRVPRELRSEREVLKAEETGELIIVSLNVIVNCPVVRVGGQFLPLARLPEH
jgi:hypothetical protein